MKKNENFITVVDVGSSKVCCLIAERSQDNSQELEIKGIGLQRSDGIKNGSIVDMEKVERSIRQTVQTAEKMAKVTIENIIVNFFESRYESRRFKTALNINGGEIGDQDLKKIWHNCIKENITEDQKVLHTTPINYSVDGKSGISDPRGMYGKKLECMFHIVTTSQQIISNLKSCINRCHLEVGQIVLSPYASGIACIKPDEKKLGVTCIDIGGGTTSVATFVNEKFVFAKTLPIGGENITNDIASGLSTSISDAERIKTTHGSVIPTNLDENESIDVPLLVGDEEGSDIHQIPRSLLNGFIRPRLEEILEHVRDSLENSGIKKENYQFIVATGGAIQMAGIRELISQFMENKQTRIATQPKRFKGEAEATTGSSFATVKGLLEHARIESSKDDFRSYNFMMNKTNLAHKIITWFKDNLNPL